MTRRTFIGTLAAVAGALGLRRKGEAKPGAFVYTVDNMGGHLAHARMLCDGTEVPFCYEACPDQGWAMCYGTNRCGGLPTLAPDRSGPLRVRYEGRIQVIDKRTGLEFDWHKPQPLAPPPHPS